MAMIYLLTIVLVNSLCWTSMPLISALTVARRERSIWSAEMFMTVHCILTQMPLCRGTVPLLSSNKVCIPLPFVPEFDPVTCFPNGTSANMTRQISEGTYVLGPGDHLLKKPERTSWSRRNHTEREDGHLSGSS